MANRKESVLGSYYPGRPEKKRKCALVFRGWYTYGSGTILRVDGSLQADREITLTITWWLMTVVGVNF